MPASLITSNRTKIGLSLKSRYTIGGLDFEWWNARFHLTFRYIVVLWHMSYWKAFHYHEIIYMGVISLQHCTKVPFLPKQNKTKFLDLLEPVPWSCPNFSYSLLHLTLLVTVIKIVWFTIRFLIKRWRIWIFQRIENMSKSKTELLHRESIHQSWIDS